MAKETKLKDDAFIYQKDDHKTQKQQWKDMNWKQKKQYFLDYYLRASIIGLIVVIGAGYLIYTMFFRQQKECVLYTAIIYDMYEPNAKEDLITKFGDYIGIDTEKQEIKIDDNFFQANDNGASSRQRLMTYIMASEIDIIIAPESEFEQMAINGNFVDLTEQLPIELYSELVDSMYFTTLVDSEKKSPYGIHLESNEIVKQLHGITEKPILGIVANAKQKNNANEFIKFIFNLD